MVRSDHKPFDCCHITRWQEERDRVTDDDLQRWTLPMWEKRERKERREKIFSFLSVYKLSRDISDAPQDKLA